MEKAKLRIAFVKFAGMTIGGSELWLQKIAVNLPKDIVDIDFYYCDDTPYIGGNHVLAKTDNDRITYLQKNGVNVIKFNVESKNIRSLTYDWINTDFWEKFDESKYDIIQTVKAGPREYPFFKMKKPIVEIVALANRPDTGKNIAWSFHSSNWQRAQWIRLGGSVKKSSVLTAPVEKSQSEENYRKDLGIVDTDIVAGFHQRNDNLIASEIPLLAFSELVKEYPEESKHWHFIIKNGGSFYRDQSKKLGTKNVHFLEQTTDSASVSKFLNTLDFFAHGRKDGETFGAVLVEAMMHGKPCLSHYSKDGANAQPETMGPAGIFAYNFDEYKRYLLCFFNDKKFRDNLASKAKPHAEKYYSMDRCISEIINVYKNITNDTLKSKEVVEQTVSYGYSNLGFLYAWDINNISSVAQSVITGTVPDAFCVALLQSLLPCTRTFLDIQNDAGLYGWIAANYYEKNKTYGQLVTIHEPQRRNQVVIQAIKSLNKWEDLVTTIQDKEELLLNQYDIIHIDLPQDNSFVKTLLKENEGYFPVIVLTLESNNLVLLPDFFVKNYNIFISKQSTLKKIKNLPENDKPATIICLHKEKHIQELQIINSTVKKYRKENLILNILSKEKLTQIVAKIIPPYITKKRLLSYTKRIFRFN